MASSGDDRAQVLKSGGPEYMKVQQYGNSPGVHIPADRAQEVGIEKGDTVAVRVKDDGCIEITASDDD